MKAFVVAKYKAPVQLMDVPEPTVGERDVLVQMRAAGLNHQARVDHHGGNPVRCRWSP